MLEKSNGEKYNNLDSKTGAGTPSHKMVAIGF